MHVASILLYLIPLALCNSPDFYIVRSRLEAALLPYSPDGVSSLYVSASEYAKSLTAGGYWPDIDYEADNPTYWAAAYHLNPRLLDMAAAYVTPDQPLYNSSSLLSQITSALNFWLEKDFINSNWWWNDIGAPTPLGEICFLLHTRNLLTPAQTNTAVSYFNRAFTQGATGANYVWMAYVHILRGFVTDNETDVKTSFAGSFAQISIAPGEDEGIKIDGSFFQHGQQLYNGGYGDNFTETLLPLVFMTANTSYFMTNETLSIWSLFILDGSQWMTNFGYWDYSVRGRQITRAISYYSAFPPRYLSSTPGPRHNEWVQFADRLVNGSYSPLVGNKHFWKADYMVHHRTHYAASLRMYSNRTYNSECVNEEGLKSLHLSDGVFNIYQTGDEFGWIFPVWDWERIPGITCALGQVPNNCATLKVLGKSDFVGGVSDGMYGASVFDFKAALTSTLSARKSWFFFDDEIVALGANITSGDDVHPIVTSINQVLLRGDVYINSSAHKLPVANQTFQNLEWIFHDNVGYFPIGASDVGISNVAQNGSWNSIGAFNGSVSTPVFSAWFNHKGDYNGSYQYVVVPGIPLEFIQIHGSELIADVVVLENSAYVQAVLQKELDILQAVFWEATGQKIQLAAYAVTTNSPCAIIVNLDSRTKTVTVTLSDPTQTRSDAIDLVLTLSLKGNNCTINQDGTSTMTFELPTGDLRGSSVTLSCQFG